MFSTTQHDYRMVWKSAGKSHIQTFHYERPALLAAQMKCREVGASVQIYRLPRPLGKSSYVPKRLWTLIADTKRGAGFAGVEQVIQRRLI